MKNGIKVYGFCLDRLRYQIANVKQKSEKAADSGEELVLLESYNSGDVQDILDILEIEDLQDYDLSALSDKLSEVAHTLSNLTGEAISFGYNDAGHLGLYLSLNGDNEYLSDKTFQNSAPINFCMR